MIIKPETYNKWEKVLDDFDKAEELFKNKEFEQAKEKANYAFIGGLRAFAHLIQDLEMPKLAANLANIFYHWEETVGGKHHTPLETIEWVRKALNRISDETPPKAKFRSVR